MKKIYFSVVTVIFGVFLLTTTASAEILDQGKDMTEDEIQQKIMDIADKYEIGEQFSEEDAQFIKEHAQPVADPGQISTFSNKSKKVSGSKSNSKVSAKISGTINNNIGWVHNSFGGNVKTTVTKGKPTSIDTRIHGVAFGTVGSGGIGKVQDKTIHSKCNGTKTCTNGRTHRFTAPVVAYQTVTASAVVTYSGGSLSVEAK